MFFRPKIERDPGVQKLEQDVFAKLKEITKSEPLQQGEATTDLQFVSFEDAIKELAEMNRSN
jgi:hypothetical protein